MNVLVVPMFALSRMGGPWSRAQAVAAALERAGHRVTLGVSADGNCHNPRVNDTLDLPVPSPLGLPMAIASRTFPIAEKLGISGRKPVHSFEEVLWLTGALGYAYERDSVSTLVDAIEDRRIDAVYSEYSIPSILAARAAGVPVYGSFSYTTQTSYASDPGRAQGLRKLLAEMGLPVVESSLDLFGWLERRYVPSCHTLEPIDDPQTQFVGFLKEPPEIPNGERDCIVVYLGTGSVPQNIVERTVIDAFSSEGPEVYVAGMQKQRTEGNVHFAPRFDFSQLLPRARCFVHHGGQNSTMDALMYATPQVIVPGRIFERVYNAQSIDRASAGAVLEHFNAQTLSKSVRLVTENRSFAQAAESLHAELASLGGADAIASSIG